MKGGITSGIVYPLAACELARQYRFRSIGGSSAGAIGAVLVAAAEHGRDTGGFRRLAEIPIKLGPHLGDLFTAGPSTATALAVLKGWLQPEQPKRQRIGHVLRTLVGAQRRPFLVAPRRRAPRRHRRRPGGGRAAARRRRLDPPGARHRRAHPAGGDRRGAPRRHRGRGPVEPGQPGHPGLRDLRRLRRTRRPRQQPAPSRGRSPTG